MRTFDPENDTDFQLVEYNNPDKRTGAIVRLPTRTVLNEFGVKNYGYHRNGDQFYVHKHDVREDAVRARNSGRDPYFSPVVEKQPARADDDGDKSPPAEKQSAKTDDDGSKPPPAEKKTTKASK